VLFVPFVVPAVCCLNYDPIVTHCFSRADWSTASQTFCVSSASRKLGLAGVPAAMGYADEIGAPLELGLIRNHYVGRTFIQPTQSMRDFGVRIKLNPVKKLLKGKDIIIIEDSIIRGTTVRTRVKALRELGVKKVHMRVSGPPHRFPCHYGIDFSTRGELIASRKTVEELRNFLGLDSLYYLSIDGLLNATEFESPEKHFCKACFDGCYPVAFDMQLSKDCLESN